MIRFQDFYDWLESDWTWNDIPMVDDDYDDAHPAVPQTDEVWHINAFGFHPEMGFAILEEEIEVIFGLQNIILFMMKCYYVFYLV